jgi:hypothetical protein
MVNFHSKNFSPEKLAMKYCKTGFLLCDMTCKYCSKD